MRVYTRGLLLVASLSLGHLSATAKPQHDHMQMPTAPADCTDTSFRCATSATPFLTADGQLWLAWAASGYISVATSADLGRSFSQAVRINSKPVTLDTGPDERPQVVVDRQGRAVVSYAIFKNDKFDGQIFVAASRDRGATFSTPYPITNDDSSQRFITLHVDGENGVFAAWVDKRNVVNAKKAGKAFAGASLAFAWSTDAGATFAATRIAHDETCECCRLGVAFAGAGRPAVLFRNIFSGERDHAVMTFTDRSTPGPVHRVSEDHWKIDVCPHHGPSLAIDGNGNYHAAWFTGGGVRQGVFYARSRDGGRTFTDPLSVGRAASHPSRPYLLSVGPNLWLAWKEFDGERTTIHAMRSTDGGAHWSSPRVVVDTQDFSDHPLLVSDGQRAYLSWLTRNEGYRLVRLDSPMP